MSKNIEYLGQSSLAAKRLVYSAGVIAASEGYATLELVKALKVRKVRRVLLREFEKWKSERSLDNLPWSSLDSELKGRCAQVVNYFSRVFPLIDFDGSFLEAFLTFLIENKEEIFELIKDIIEFIGSFSLNGVNEEDDISFEDDRLFEIAAGLS